MDDRALLDRNDIEEEHESDEEEEKSDFHFPTHQSLGKIVCKYKFYIIIMLACIITTIFCCVLIPQPSINTTKDPNSTVAILTWESYFAINCVMATILLMLIGFPPDLILVAISVTLTLIPCSREECRAQFNKTNSTGGSEIDCSSGAFDQCTIISMKQAWKGFQSTSVLSIGVLFMVAKGVEKTGIISYLAQFVLGSPKYLWVAILRMCLPVSIISAFINDTPVVAVMMPIIESWAIKTGTPVSKLMIPLSYAALLGGMCTLTGTSTNLVLQGLVKTDKNAVKDKITVTMFEMTPVGACVAVTCIVYMALAARCLLPNHHVHDDDAPALADDNKAKGTSDETGRTALESFDSRRGNDHKAKRKFVVDLVVKPKSGLKGKPIHLTLLGDNENLDVLSANALVDRESQGDDLEGDEVPKIEGGDVIVVAATVGEILKLRQNRDVSLKRQPRMTATLKAGRRHRVLYEVVVAPENPLVGTRVRDRFIRSLHRAEILAVRHTAGEVLSDPNGPEDSAAGHVIKAHDTLLVESYPSFGKKFKTDTKFISVTQIEGSTPPRNYTKGDNVRMLISGLILALMITGIVLDSGLVFEWAIIASYLLVWTHCLTALEAYKAVKGRVILGILAAIGLGSSLENTGVALAVANGMVQIGEALGSPLLMLSLIYYCVALLSCVAGNQATVIILYPIVSEIVVQLKGELSLSQFVVVLIMGASSSFMSPFSYQTNLMVWTAGKYKFADYPKFGGPMTLLAGIVTGVATYYIIPITSPS